MRVSVRILVSIVCLVSGVSGLATAGPLFPNPQLDTPGGGVSAAVGDFNNDGFPDVVTLPCLGCYGIPQFFAGRGDGTFKTGVTAYSPPPYPGRGLIGRAQVGDWNRDGNLDLAFGYGAESPYAPTRFGSIGISLGHGDGTFGPPEFFGAYADADDAPIVGDFNGDGRDDFASFNRSGPDVTVLLGGGDGSLTSVGGLRVSGQVSSMVAADFNEDGRDALVVADGATEALTLYAAHTDGTFAPPVSLMGSGTILLALDVDADGHEDLVFASATHPTAISVLLNDGHGFFTRSVDTPFSQSVQEIASADLNGDGLPDLLLGVSDNPASTLVHNVVVLMGGPHGSFVAGPVLPLGAAGRSIRVMDANLDGHWDIVSTSVGSGRPALLLGRGDGSFDAPALSTVGSGPTAVVAQDFNGDGIPDVAVVNGTSKDFSVLLGRADGSLGHEQRYSLGELPAALTAGDFDGDGAIDLVVSTAPNVPPYRGHVYFFHGRGDGGFDAGRLITDSDSGVSAVVALDYDSDGKLDLAMGSTGFVRPSSLLFVMHGRGDGSFEDVTSIAGFSTVYAAVVLSIAVGDFDHDGRPDVAACVGGALFVYLNAGSGNWHYPPYYDAPGCSAVATGDFDHDGLPDLAVSRSGDPRVLVPGLGVAVYSGNGDGSFKVTWPSGTLFLPKGIVAADFDGDGIDDLAIADTGEGRVAVMRSHGDRTFEDLEFFGAAGANGIVSPDLDRDGRQDLIVAGAGVLSVLSNHGPRPDQDGDGIPNALDQCTDSDGDGFGDPGFPANTCSVDNCPAIANGDQSDRDGDGIGDACDSCPDDPLNDRDSDGICGNVDRCANRSDPTRSDIDGDGVPDACDNCRATPNPDQKDSNNDGSGDACQPTVSILGIGPDLSGDLRVSIDVRDPLGGALTHRLAIREEPYPIVVPNLIDGPLTCDRGYDLGGTGRGFFYLDTGNPALYDLDSGFADNGLNACQDGQPDYWLAAIACSKSSPITDYWLALDLFQPGLGGPGVASDVCIRPYGSLQSGFELSMIRVDETALTGAIAAVDPILAQQFVGKPPALISPTGLVVGRNYTLEWTVTDGETIPVTARASFVYDGEPSIVISAPPRAAVQGTATAECEQGQGTVFLDGSMSTDPDSTPGSQDDIASFAWYEDYGLPGQRLLGVSETLSVRLSLGTHALTLQVTDQEGNSDTAAAAVHVVDTQPPALACPSIGASECAGPSGTSVSLVATATDACSGTATVVNDRTSNGADASGLYPLGSTLVTYHAVDPAGNQSTCTVPVVVQDTRPPVVDCPTRLPAAECEGAGGAHVTLTATAHDACTGAASVANDRTQGGGDASGSYSLGTTSVTFTATDASGNPGTCTSYVTVQDTQPPTLSVFAEPATLWPPNHELVPVHPAWQARDLCDPNPAVALVSVTNSEPDDAPGQGDGKTTGDIAGADIGTADREIDLRAERDGSGPGRTYTLMYKAVDASGNSTPAFAVVAVPHDQGSGPEPLLMQLEPDGTPGMARIYWAGIPGAVGYDVISGDLSQAKVVDHQLSLGAVRILARGTTEASLTEGASGVIPAPGTAIFYLIQARTDRGGGGYGTESAPWPRMPSSCDGGCP